MFRPTKILPSALAAAIVLSAAGETHAVDLAGGVFEMVLQRPDDGGEGFLDMSETEIAEWFNLSNCTCGVEFAVEVTLRDASGTLASEQVEVWVGTNCDVTSDLTLRDSQCTQITVIPDINDLKTSTIIPINTAEIMQIGITQSGVAPPPYDCISLQQEVSRNIYLLVDDDGDLTYENVHTFADDLFADTQLPPSPEPAELARGEQGALVSWSVPESNADDIRSYQILCAREDSTVNADDGFPRDRAAYRSPLVDCPELFGLGSIAPGPAVPDGGPVDGGVPDAGIPVVDAGPPPTGIKLLDPMFVCSGELGSTESEHRVEGLTNGVSYQMLLVTIDPRLNPLAIDLGTITPTAVTDFWEDYQDSGGAADGEYCFVATATYGDYDHPFVRVLRDFRDESLASTHFGRRLIRAYYDNSPGLATFIARHPIARAIAWVLLVPLVAFAGVWVYTGLLGKLALAFAFALWRVYRRRRAAQRPDDVDHRPPRKRLTRAAAVATGVVLLVAAAQTASAQPYWDEPGGPADKQGTTELDKRRSQWTFELKFGPYLPDIDSEFSLGEGEQGPYEQMFGGAKLMTVMELDRYVLHPKGQLGVGVGLGFFSTSANAFAIDANGDMVFDPDTMERVRSEGDKTKLTIVPISLSAVYRFTALDDQWGVPLIPYGKIGLSWYFWRVTRPDGKTASVNQDPSCATDCAKNRARGGTTGYQATVGLSIRTERLDRKSAIALREDMGIEHAGVFAEMTYAEVDGMTGGDRLHVGDTTWSAGINFEF